MGCSASSSNVMNDKLECILTSTAIAKTQDNMYPEHICGWLTPHEPIRRDILRGERALECMQLLVHPWQMINFYHWYTKYFVLVVHAHHDHEENIVGPFYKNLGEDTTDWGKSADHKGIIDLMSNVDGEAKELFQLIEISIKNGNSCDESLLRRRHVALKGHWAAFKLYIFHHLVEEELFWPQIYKKHGTKLADKVLGLIHAEDRKLRGEPAAATQAFAGAVFDALGFFPPSYMKKNKYFYDPPPNSLQFSGPWCGPSYTEEFRQKVPFVIRKFLLPMFHKTFIVKWKAMIDGVCGTVDTFQLQNKTVKKDLHLSSI